ncbi:MAG TPA: hypothetical protein VNK89_00185 [Thermoflexus sp.]|nr:hypothetical protein [Thermoflexus sp.]
MNGGSTTPEQAATQVSLKHEFAIMLSGRAIKEDDVRETIEWDDWGSLSIEGNEGREMMQMIKKRWVEKPDPDVAVHGCEADDDRMDDVKFL